MDLKPITEPIINFVTAVEGPLLILVGVLGVLYCINLGVKLATAATPERRANAISHLLTAIVAYFLIFVMIYLLKTYTPALQAWVEGDPNALKSVSIDLSAPIEQAGELYRQSKEIVNGNKDTEVIKDTVSDIVDSGKDFVGNQAEGISNIGK